MCVLMTIVPFSAAIDALLLRVWAVPANIGPCSVPSDSHRKLPISKGRARLKYFSWDCCVVESLDI